MYFASYFNKHSEGFKQVYLGSMKLKKLSAVLYSSNVSNTISFCKHESESIPAFSQSFSCATAEGVIRYADCDLLDTSLGDLNNPLITCVKMALSFPPFLPLCDQPLCSSPQWGQNIFRLALIRIQKLR